MTSKKYWLANPEAEPWRVPAFIGADSPNSGDIQFTNCDFSGLVAFEGSVEKLTITGCSFDVSKQPIVNIRQVKTLAVKGNRRD